MSALFDASLCVAVTVAIAIILQLGAQRRVASECARLETLSSGLPDAVLWINASGCIDSCNEAAERLFGCSRGSIVGTAATIFLPELTSPSAVTRAALHGVDDRRSHILPRLETHAADCDGVAFPVAVWLRRCPRSVQTRSVVVVRDLTFENHEQRELTRYADQLLLTKRALESQNEVLEATVQSRTNDLLRAKEAAERASATKSEFLANMSHEFRTPLHGILSFARFGQRRMAQSSTRKLLQYFESIEKCSTKLLDLVNHLLDLAKLEEGKVEFDKKTWDFVAIAKDVLSEFHTVAQEKGVSLKLRVPTDSATVLVDRDKIEQVVRNLLSNAVKFSPRGGCVIVDFASADNSAAIRVTDQGPGIPEDELERVFDKFVQSSRTSTGAGGTGLGLAICRHIISQHGGSIWAENVQPRGASVAFTLPICDASIDATSNLAHCEDRRPYAFAESCVSSCEPEDQLCSSPIAF